MTCINAKPVPDKTVPRTEARGADLPSSPFKPPEDETDPFSSPM